MGVLGPERGYAVVTPDALGEPREWNMFGDPARGDDFDFALSLIAELSETLCVDTDRIYADGHSNGSAFVAFLSCREPRPLAAVALVSATVPTDCGGEGPARSVIAVHGTADPLVPYDGGDMPGGQGVPGAPGAMQATAEALGCDPATEEAPMEGVERTTYAGCRDGAEVVLDTIVGGKHLWPGGQGAARDAGTSQAALDYPASEAILDFFDRHSLA
jgi:polyhydroxybutyrate depolymerase